MPTLLIAITAVIFAAFGVLAGVNYVDPDLKSRIQTSRALSAQYASLYSAVSTYRFENGGLAPKALSDVDGYLTPEARAGFGKLSTDFSWQVIRSAAGRAGLCLVYKGGVQNDAGVVAGLARFAGEAARQHPGVTFGDDCAGAPVARGLEKDFVERMLETKSSIALRFQEVH